MDWQKQSSRESARDLQNNSTGTSVGRGGIETLVSNWAVGHLFDILANNLVALLYPCPENLYEAKFKSNKLISLAEKI